MSERSILLGVSSNCSDAIDGRVFVSIPFDRQTLGHLPGRASCYRKAREVYPDLYDTYEFHYLPQWYETGKSEEYDNQSDRDKLARLSYDAEPGEGSPCDGSLCEGLDRLEAQEVNALVVPAETLPSTGNMRTECDQLVMSRRGDASDIVDLRWICYVKHTDVELRTTEINSEDIDHWLTELEQEEDHVEEATQGRS